MTKAQKVIKYIALALAALIIFGIFSGICGALTVFFDITDRTEKNTDNSSYSTSDDYKSLTPEGDVLSLDIDIEAADFVMQTGEELSVQAAGRHITLRQQGTTLKIEEDHPDWLINNETARITVTVPADYNFTLVEFDAGAGRIDIESLCSKKLEFDLGAGEVTVHKLNVTRSADIDGGAGKITVRDGEVNGLELDMGVGELDMTARLMGSCSVDCGVGNTKITLLGSSQDYTVRADKGMGSITLDGDKMSGNMNYGNGENLLRISGGVGNIEIAYKAQ